MIMMKQSSVLLENWNTVLLENSLLSFWKTGILSFWKTVFCLIGKQEYCLIGILEQLEYWNIGILEQAYRSSYSGFASSFCPSALARLSCSKTSITLVSAMAVIS